MSLRPGKSIRLFLQILMRKLTLAISMSLSNGLAIQGWSRRSRILTLTFLILFACGQRQAELTGVDLTAWKQDPQGCKGLRSKMIRSLDDQRKKLLGMSEMDIIDLLGRPDENELYTRNQKFYHYFLEPSAACQSEIKSPKMLVIRFSALGLANEVSVE
jgi:hypothetical protein